MATRLTRKRFVQGSAAVGGGLAMAGPLSALYANSARGGGSRPKSHGYGPLSPTPALGSGIEYLALPPGFAYRLVQRSGDPMTDGNPCPGIFDGMAAFRGRRGDVVLVRNHENRSRDGEVGVAVPESNRYDPDAAVRGGNTKLVVGPDGTLEENFAVLGGTHTNCAGGATPWGTWITCEEIFNYGATGTTPGSGVPHGYSFEVPADASGPVTAVPMVDAGRFSHEAVAWSRGVLYETEDRGDAGLYRFLPNRPPREAGDLATHGGVLQALRIKGRPNFDANLADPRDTYRVEWVSIDEPNPTADTVRKQAQSQGAAIFDRTEGAWAHGGSVFFDCTTGGEAQLGQVWQLIPSGRHEGTLRLLYESVAPEDLEHPDNLVVVPATRDVFAMEDSGPKQFVRGITRSGRIYDFAETLLNTSEFCGGCFSPDGRTFFVNQQGRRLGVGQTPESQPDAEAGLTFAITGPFGRRRQ